MEIERKILEIDRDAVLEKLRALGATQTFAGLIRVKYFDYPDGRIHRCHNLLRLREFINDDGTIRTELVFKIDKKVIDGCKVYDELELFFDEPDSFKKMCEFFRRLQLQETMHYEKRRSQFSYKKWKFELDEYPKIPPLIEVEAADAKTIEEGIALLGLEKFSQSAETIEELMKNRYPNVQLSGLHF